MPRNRSEMTPHRRDGLGDRGFVYFVGQQFGLPLIGGLLGNADQDGGDLRFFYVLVESASSPVRDTSAA